MLHRFLTIAALLAAAGIGLAQAEKVGPLEGKFVRFTDGKLVLVDVQGKEHIHIVAPGTEIQIDGKAAKIDELRPGFQLRLLPREGKAFPRLEARRAAIADKVAAPFSREGTFVRADGASKVVVTDKDGKESVHVLAPNVEITVNGKMAKLEDVKPQMSLRVFTAKEDPKTVYKIDATSPK